MKNEETGRQDKETYDRKSAMAGINTEAKQREQSREHSSLKDRLEKNKRIVADWERENAHRSSHDRGMSR